MNESQNFGSALPLGAGPEEYINRPLEDSIASLTQAIIRAESEPSFDCAFDVCDFARSAFAAYLVESALNGGGKFRIRVVQLMDRAQSVLKAALARERKIGGDRIRYLEDYLLHNSNRVRVVEVLHSEGREAAERKLVCA